MSIFYLEQEVNSDNEKAPGATKRSEGDVSSCRVACSSRVGAREGVADLVEVEDGQGEPPADPHMGRIS